MLIDCFPFFNELDILELRLNILDKVVDKFILVEASKTQTKLDKPFYFEENKNRYSKFLDKIIHIKIEETPEENGWAMENFQRNCIFNGINQIDLNDDDYIAVSDVDEIWDPNIVSQLDKLLKNNEYFSVDMRYLVFYLNLETLNKKWIGTVFTKVKKFKEINAQYLRDIKDRIPYIKNAGWHFGYQGGKKIVYQKFLSCIEPFDKTCLPTEENFSLAFDNKIKDNGSFIFSDNLNNDSIKLEKIKNEYLPRFLQDNIEKYSNMFYKI
jgi:beta-1,4-mannosyl-glycoprotein beta-1,4-N-acetylglucosaminyltransferase